MPTELKPVAEALATICAALTPVSTQTISFDDAVHRILATDIVAAYDHPPAAVSEAFRRLAEYMADDTDRAGVSSYSVNMGGAIQESYQRSAAHAARALQNSGAADLLRPYRRQK